MSDQIHDDGTYAPQAGAVPLSAPVEAMHKTRLGALLVAIRELESSPEPAVMFSRVADVCASRLASACLVSLIERADEAPYHVRAGVTAVDSVSRPAPDAHEIRSAHHTIDRHRIVLPVVPPPTPDEMPYRGRLELFWRSGHQPGSVDMVLAQVVVDHAVAEVHRARMAEQLRIDRARAANLEIALKSNRDIGMATGILMARHVVTAEDAFRLLVRVSQLTHRKLRDIATEVILTGTLPHGMTRGWS